MSRNGPSFDIHARPSVSVPGAVLFTRSTGAGATMIAIHGGLGLDHQYLAPALDALASSARIVCPDLRGHGQSTGRDTLATSDHSTFVADIEALREHLGADRVVLFGHSYGGFLAIEYALAHPEHVRGIVLCATSPSLSHAPQALATAAQRATEQESEALAAAFAGPTVNDERFAAIWRSLVPLYFKDRSRALAPFETSIFSAAGYDRGAFALLASYDVRERLKEITAPVLIMSGAHDWLMPPELAGNVMKSALPNARHVVFKESGHFPFVEEPGAFASEMTVWLATLPA